MDIIYFKAGEKHGFTARDINDAVRRKSALRKQYGKGFSGCGSFHYFQQGNLHWL